jgi:hypothetical protein
MDPQSLAIEFPTTEPRERTQQEVTHGAKLICINDKNLHRNYHPGPVVEGQVYCVRELYTQGGVPGVLLVGIVGPFDFGGLECGFLLSRFRWVHD